MTVRAVQRRLGVVLVADWYKPTSNRCNHQQREERVVSRIAVAHENEVQ